MSWKHYQKGKTTTERGYGRAWQIIRKQALERDKHLCQECLRNERYIEAKEVDHIIEKASGGTDDLTNLQSLCTPCHKIKTNKKKIAPCNTDGWPTNSDHHWNNNA